MIHGILFVQFTSLTVFSDNLSPGPLWSSSWPWTLNFILHAFLHPKSSSSFRSTCPYQRSLFCCNTNAMSSIPSLSLSSLLGSLSFNLTPHILTYLTHHRRNSALITGLPWGRNFYPHTHPIHTDNPVGIPTGSPYPQNPKILHTHTRTLSFHY